MNVTFFTILLHILSTYADIDFIYFVISAKYAYVVRRNTKTLAILPRKPAGVLQMLLF